MIKPNMALLRKVPLEKACGRPQGKPTKVLHAQHGPQTHDREIKSLISLRVGGVCGGRFQPSIGLNSHQAGASF